jgi:hypothetical protein
MGAIAELYATIGADTGQFQKALSGVKSALGQLGGLIGGISFVGIFGAAVKAASESEDALALFNATLRSTGSTAGVTSQAALALASSLQKTTRYSDETVLSVETLLLRMRGMSKDILPGATRATLDLATALGIDTSSAAKMLGKALQDPIGSMGALSRAGIKFTDQQERQLKALVRSGNQLKAQKYLLDQVTIATGGAAAAAGSTFAGTLDRLSNAFGDVLENLGNALIPTLKTFADILLSVAGVMQNVDPGFVQLAAAIGLVVVAAGPLGAILGVILGPLGAIGLAVGALYAAWTNNFGGLRTTVENAWAQIQGPLNTIKDAVGKFFDTLFNGPTVKPKGHVGISEMMKGEAPDERAILEPFERIKIALTNLGTEIQGAVGKLLQNLAPALGTAADIFNRATTAATQLAAILGFGLGVALSVVAGLLNQAAITAGQLGLILRTGVADALSKIDATSLGYVVVGLSAISALVIGNKIALGISAIVTAIQALAAGATLTLPALGPLGLVIGTIGVVTFLAANNVLGLGDRIKELGTTLVNGSPGFQTWVNDNLVNFAGKLGATIGLVQALLKAIQELVAYISGHPVLHMSVQINQTGPGLGMPGVAPDWNPPPGMPGHRPGEAAGGPVTSGMFTAVRDNEFFRPAASGQIIPLSAMHGGSDGGSGNVIINGPITVVAPNPQKFYDAMRDEALRRNKPVAGSM